MNQGPSRPGGLAKQGWKKQTLDQQELCDLTVLNWEADHLSFCIHSEWSYWNWSACMPDMFLFFLWPLELLMHHQNQFLLLIELLCSFRVYATLVKERESEVVCMKKMESCNCTEPFKGSCKQWLWRWASFINSIKRFCFLMLHIDPSVNNGILMWHVGVRLSHICAWFYSEEKTILCV